MDLKLTARQLERKITNLQNEETKQIDKIKRHIQANRIDLARVACEKKVFLNNERFYLTRSLQKLLLIANNLESKIHQDSGVEPDTVKIIDDLNRVQNEIGHNPDATNLSQKVNSLLEEISTGNAFE